MCKQAILETCTRLYASRRNLPREMRFAVTSFALFCVCFWYLQVEWNHRNCSWEKKKNVQKFIYHCRTVDQVYLNHAWNAGNKAGPTRTGMTNGLHGLLHALLLLQPLDLPLGLGASRVVFICWVNPCTVLNMRPPSSHAVRTQCCVFHRRGQQSPRTKSRGTLLSPGYWRVALRIVAVSELPWSRCWRAAGSVANTAFQKTNELLCWVFFARFRIAFKCLAGCVDF